MRLLISQHQLNLVQVTVENSKQPVVIADASGRILLSNEAFSRRFQSSAPRFVTLENLADGFAEPAQAHAMLRTLRERRLSWKGELTFGVGTAQIPVGVRADLVSGPQGATLGFILMFTDLSENKRADAARRHLEAAIYQASRADVGSEPGSSLLQAPDEVIGAILANARLAALDIADGCGDGAVVAPLIEELENSTQRATAIYAQLSAYGRSRD